MRSVGDYEAQIANAVIAPAGLDTAWLKLAVRTVIAGARAGTLVRGR